MTTLYRVYGMVDGRDKDGFGPVGTTLLYVGITDDYDNRMRQHSEKRWWESVTRITRQEFEDRSEAARAESAAIRTERPLHNRSGNAHPPKDAYVPKPSRHATPNPWLTLQEAADHLGVCTRTVRRYISMGELPASRIKSSRAIRLRLSDVDGLLKPIPMAGIS